jgi:hypothetical protein
MDLGASDRRRGYDFLKGFGHKEKGTGKLSYLIGTISKCTFVAI